MRNYSNTDIKYIECINNKLNKWRIRWDIQPEYQQNKEGNQEEKGVSFIEYEFNHKPSLDEIKDVVLNGTTIEQILKFTLDLYGKIYQCGYLKKINLTINQHLIQRYRPMVNHYLLHLNLVVSIQFIIHLKLLMN